MRHDAQVEIQKHFETYLHEPRLHEYRICLRHGDFGAGNILIDPDHQSISGIIDFGGLGLGDPALDIAAISCFGKPFLKRFCLVYPQVESMEERAHFYKGFFALEEALYGLRNKDPEAFENGISAYI